MKLRNLALVLGTVLSGCGERPPPTIPNAIPVGNWMIRRVPVIDASTKIWEENGPGGKPGMFTSAEQYCAIDRRCEFQGPFEIRQSTLVDHGLPGEWFGEFSGPHPAEQCEIRDFEMKPGRLTARRVCSYHDEDDNLTLELTYLLNAKFDSESFNGRVDTTAYDNGRTEARGYPLLIEGKRQ